MVYCKACNMRKIAKFGKANEGGLCSHCAYAKGLLVDKEAMNKKRRDAKYVSCQSMIRMGGSLPRQKKDNPTMSVGLKLRGRKFEDWANAFIEENL